MLDIEKQTILWEGKNVPADELQLKVPMLDYDCTFGDHGNTITTATAYGKLRMHDFREVKKRPIKDIKLDKHPLTRILQRSADNKLIVSSNIGQVFYVDPKANYSIVKKFNNAQGCITDMDLSTSQTQFCTGKFWLTPSESRPPSESLFLGIELSGPRRVRLPEVREVQVLPG